MWVRKTKWRRLAIAIATMQIIVAVAVLNVSYQNPISDLACLGGIFGSLVNIVILVALGLWSLYLGYRSYRAKALHPVLRYVPVVAVSSFLAIYVSAEAALLCTV